MKVEGRPYTDLGQGFEMQGLGLPGGVGGCTGKGFAPCGGAWGGGGGAAVTGGLADVGGSGTVAGSAMATVLVIEYGLTEPADETDAI